MKKIFLPAVAGLAMLTFASCDSGTTDETTTDSVVTETTTSSMETSGSTIDMDASYMDLSSGKTFTIARDTVTTYYVNRETREPVLYYVNVATNDTFDRSGRWINGALIKMDDGSFSVDESRLKVKTDEDGDIKIKDGDDSKMDSQQLELLARKKKKKAFRSKKDSFRTHNGDRCY